MNDPEAASYVSGIGVHWYWDNYSPASVLNETHHNHPDKFLLGTEACAGSGLFEQAVVLGSWERGEDYSHDIIEVMFISNKFVITLFTIWLVN